MDMLHIMCIVMYVVALMDRPNHVAHHMIFCPAFPATLSVPFSSLLTKHSVLQYRVFTNLHDTNISLFLSYLSHCCWLMDKYNGPCSQFPDNTAF